MDPRDKKQLQRLYDSRPFLEAYTEHTDARVRINPQTAIGGQWDELGSLQFRFLCDQGLAPSNRLLDIGCGTLRGGRHFIRYLDKGQYSGFDLSPEAIAAARRLVAQEGLTGKCPNLAVNRDQSLDFQMYEGQQFDFILAQSVFTHLMPEHIEQCLCNVRKVMAPSSGFYFTWLKSDRYKQIGHKGFAYPRSFFCDLAAKYDLVARDLSEFYPHPRGQRMTRVSLRA